MIDAGPRMLDFTIWSIRRGEKAPGQTCINHPVPTVVYHT